MRGRPRELYRVMDEAEYLRLAPEEMPSGATIREAGTRADARRGRLILLFAVLAAGAIGVLSVVRRGRPRGSRMLAVTAATPRRASLSAKPRELQRRRLDPPSSAPGTYEADRGRRRAKAPRPVPLDRLESVERRRRLSYGDLVRGGTAAGSALGARAEFTFEGAGR